MFSCKKAAQLLSESLDRKLTFWQRARLRVHLVICRMCAGFARDMQRLDAAMQKYAQQIESDSTAKATLRPEARLRILQAIKNESNNA